MQTEDSSPVELTQEEAPKSLWRETFANLIRNPSAVAGMIILGLLLLIAIFAPLIATHDPRKVLIDIPEEGAVKRMDPCIHFLGCPEAGDEILNIDAEESIVAAEYNSTRTVLLVATGNEVQVWNVEDETLRYTLSHDEPVAHAAWSPNDQQILVASGEQLTIWDINRRAVETELEHAGGARYVVWASDGTRFASAGERDVHFWLDCSQISYSPSCAGVSATSENTLVDEGVVELDDEWVTIEWNSQGTLLMVATGNNVGLYTPSVGFIRNSNTYEHEAPVNSAEFNNQSTRILTTSGNQAFVWEAASPFDLLQSFEYDRPLSSASWSEQTKGGRREVLVVANSTDSVIVWDTRDQTIAFEISLPESNLIGSATSPLATRIMTYGADRVQVWDGQSGEQIFERTLEQPLQNVEWLTSGGGILIRQDTQVKTIKTSDFQYIMGTDGSIRDEFSRLIYGTRVSLRVGFTSVTFAIIVGTLAGSISGFLGGWYDNIIMRVMDVMLAFPSLILAIAVVTILGPGLNNALLAISVVFIPHYARVARSGVLSVKEQDYVLADRALGVAPARILFRRILPNIMAPLIVQATLGIGTAILDAAALSFLGLGAQPPTAEWGYMLSEERNQLFTAPHLVFFPGAAIMITVLAFNLLGDGLRDALDPRLNR